MKKNSINIVVLCLVFLVSNIQSVEEIREQVPEKEASADVQVIKKAVKADTAKRRITREPYKFGKIVEALDDLSNRFNITLNDIKDVICSVISSNQDVLNSKLDLLESLESLQLDNLDSLKTELDLVGTAQSHQSAMLADNFENIGDDFEQVKSSQKKLSIKLKTLKEQLKAVENTESQQSVAMASSFEEVKNNQQSLVDKIENVGNGQKESAVKLDALMIVVSALVQLLDPSDTHIDSFI